MAINEASRHEMHRKLEEVLGAEVANTVMEHLPPVGWADVATKRDLDAVQVLLKGDIDALQHSMEVKFDMFQLAIYGKLDGLRVEMHREINRLVVWLFPTLLTALGLTFAVAKLS